MKKKAKVIPALEVAFPASLPVMAGYLFLGMSYGILMNVSGFSFLWPMGMALTIYGGSVEFLVANMLLGSFHPLQTFLMAFIVNARHLFYGLAMLDKFRDTGRKKAYLIFAMSDETFAVNAATSLARGIDRGWFYFWVSLLDQIYWVTGAALGGILGSFIPFDTKGLDFIMTAMFVVIFLDNWMKEERHVSSILGIGMTLIMLILFGSDKFIIPAMIGILAVLAIFRGKLDLPETEEDNGGVEG
ncbi:MAG: AzlC family ABC transporter permease [Lachnospiraceae bacterium]|nr:AzlC family ABC transporter permease [Lachnospiraceae bacterium]